MVAAALELAGTTAGAGDGTDERETIIGNVLQMQESGTQDLTALLVWVVKLLGDHPVWIDRVGSSIGAVTADASPSSRRRRPAVAARSASG